MGETTYQLVQDFIHQQYNILKVDTTSAVCPMETLNSFLNIT